MEEKEPNDAVVALVVSTKVDERVNSGGERSVEPTQALADELGGGFGDVRLSLGRLDVSENPSLVRLRDEFEAENAILGQEHVLRPDRHALRSLGSEPLRERLVTMEVLVERTTLNGGKSVGTERSRKNGDVTESRFGGLVEYVADLVLEVLSGDEGAESEERSRGNGQRRVSGRQGDEGGEEREGGSKSVS